LVARNTGNCISGQIFWGSIPPDPPIHAYSAGPFLTYKLGGETPPQSPLVPPHEITFCPPRKKMHIRPHTWPSAIAICLIYYLTERSFFKKCPPHGKILKKGPDIRPHTWPSAIAIRLIYYLTERSFFKKCPPTGKSLKKALVYMCVYIGRKQQYCVTDSFLALFPTRPLPKERLLPRSSAYGLAFPKTIYL
jgi:hypothetical protein